MTTPRSISARPSTPTPLLQATDVVDTAADAVEDAITDTKN
ncbi:MAG: hypothetical protein R2710_08935 [Acidimicrobiales bacterium]